MYARYKIDWVFEITEIQQSTSDCTVINALPSRHSELLTATEIVHNKIFVDNTSANIRRGPIEVRPKFKSL